MGIPVFFKTLITDYNHVIKPVAEESVHNLFFDLNCLIHPSCAKVEDGNEDEMIKVIIADIHKLIHLTGPKFVYIAIDGPAPKAKMVQQRSRRLKSVLEGKVWDTNAITPGTTFMNRLNEELHKEFNHPYIVISDSLEPGEGEHKILQYLRQNKEDFKDKKNCIYGLDADLIMLSLLSGINNIYLLRERTSFNIEQIDSEYLYLKIDALKKEILQEFNGVQIPKQTVIHDYCFICFLLGNDFIKHSPSLILRYDGLFHVINAYKECQQEKNNKFYLINTKTKGLLHWNNFNYLIHKLSLSENSRLKDIFSIRLKQHRKYKRIYTDIQQNKDVVKNTHKSSFPVEDIMRHKPVIFMDDEKTIFQRNIESGEWVKPYNTFTLTNKHGECHVNELSEKVQKICNEYIQSLVWTTHYYFDTCISQEWYYPYECAPTLQDLTLYLSRQ